MFPKLTSEESRQHVRLKSPPATSCSPSFLVFSGDSESGLAKSADDADDDDGATSHWPTYDGHRNPKSVTALSLSPRHGHLHLGGGRGGPHPCGGQKDERRRTLRRLWRHRTVRMPKEKEEVRSLQLLISFLCRCPETDRRRARVAGCYLSTQYAVGNNGTLSRGGNRCKGNRCKE